MRRAWNRHPDHVTRGVQHGSTAVFQLHKRGHLEQTTVSVGPHLMRLGKTGA